MRVYVRVLGMVRLGSVPMSIVCEPLCHLEQITVGVRDKGITIAFVRYNLLESIVGIKYWRFRSI